MGWLKRKAEDALRRNLPAGLFCVLLSLPASLEGQRTARNAAALEELLQRAAVHVQTGQLTAAEGELQKAILQAPGDVRALTLLGGVLGMQGRLDESSRFFEKVLKIDPGNQDARRNLAANQLQLGQISAARKNLEAILKSNPADRQAILMLGFACERAQEFRKAITYLEQVPDLVREHPDHVAALARSYYRTGQVDKARLQLRRLQDSTADPASAYLGVQISMEARDWDTAERTLDSIKSAYPRPVLVTYQRARIRYETGRYAECKSLLEPVANSPESNGTVLNLLAWCYLKGGDEGTATRILSYATDTFPAEAANFIDLGKLCLKGNRLDRGLEVVQRGVSRHPSSGPLFELKGELESRQGLHAPAMESYRQAVQLSPRSSEALLGLAIAQTNLLQNKEAIASFEKGIRLFPREARFHAEYGKILLLPWASGEIPESSAKAERLLRKAVQLDGSLLTARFELGNLLVKSQRAEEALPHLEKAAELDPANAQIRFVLARAYRALGRKEEYEREMLVFQKLEKSAGR
ncbi:MAG: tetratricopeptide repeat protein [Acidobacteria bacterium]|nr:tetratricopeptide repeat protein [Acidobacteriota bacterium]